MHKKVWSFLRPLCIGTPMTSSLVIVYVSPMNGKPAKQDTFFQIAGKLLRKESVWKPSANLLWNLLSRRRQPLTDSLLGCNHGGAPMSRPDRLKTALLDNKATPNEVLHARADNTSRAADFLSRQLEWLSWDPESRRWKKTVLHKKEKY